MAANMENFIKFLIAIGFLPLRRDADGTWRRNLFSAGFLVQILVFLSADACYLYTMWNQFRPANQTIASISGLIVKVI
jgi:hypothetical protein